LGCVLGGLAYLGQIMKSSLLCLALLATMFSGCSQDAWKKAFTARVLTVSYDDLGTEAMLKPTLGSRGTDPTILVHHGATDAQALPRRLGVHEGLLLLRKNARQLPRTPANSALRERMARTYSRMYQFYRTRRDAVMATPPFYGRGALGRAMLMPPMPPTL
jgi:hypothetical protein